MPIQIRLKSKYRAQTGSVKCADGEIRGDYYAPKNGANGDHNNKSWRKKNGAKTYDKTKHVLYVLASGKKRMVHL